MYGGSRLWIGWDVLSLRVFIVRKSQIGKLVEWSLAYFQRIDAPIAKPVSHLLGRAKYERYYGRRGAGPNMWLRTSTKPNE